MHVRIFIVGIALLCAVALMVRAQMGMEAFSDASGIKPSQSRTQTSGGNRFVLAPPSTKQLEEISAQTPFPAREPYQFPNDGGSFDPAAINRGVYRRVDTSQGEDAWRRGLNTQISRDIRGPSVPGRP